jgi:hypothetical protein
MGISVVGQTSAWGPVREVAWALRVLQAANAARSLPSREFLAQLQRDFGGPGGDEGTTP